MTIFSEFFGGGQQKQTSQTPQVPDSSKQEATVPADSTPPKQEEKDEFDISSLFREDSSQDEESDDSALPGISQLLTPEVLGKMVKNMDFVKNLPENVRNDLPDNMKAALNAVAQSAYMTAMQHQGSLMDNLLAQYDGYAQKGLDKRTKRVIEDDKLYSHDLLSDKEIRAAVSPIMDQIRKKFPQTTVEQRQKMALDVLKSISNKVSPREDTKKKSSEGETNWMKYVMETGNE